MRVRSWFLLAAVTISAAALTAVGCGSKPPTGNSAAQENPKDDPNVDVGGPLFKPAPDPKPSVVNSRVDSLVIPNCTVQYEERQQVAAEVDGKVELVAVRDDAIDPNHPLCVYHPRDVILRSQNPNHPMVKFRLLRDGEIVRKDQEICFLDDQMISAEIEAAILTKQANQEIERNAAEGTKLADDKLKVTREAYAKGSASYTDLIQDQITVTRFRENLANARAAIVKADADHKKAVVMLGKHRIKSTVNGIVRNIAKRPGEFVKAGDKIMEVQATDRVRLEGNLDVQYAPLVKRGMPVAVEPAIASTPGRTHAWHRGEVTGVTVTGHPGRPLVVSTGVDGSTLVWDLTKDAIAHNLPHPVSVRSVAVSPAGVRPALAVTGSDDGKVRVWDLTNPDKLPATPKAEPAETHSAAVGAVAFSPDGRFFATAAGREVFVWDAAEGKKLYALPADHRDSVTCLAFTPQSWLVTASKDRTLKVWKLGAEKGATAKTIDHRAGSVDVLGVSKDGSRVLFDQDKGRIDIVSLADKQTVGQIQNLGPTAVFSTVAVFNPEETLLVTAGGEGELKGAVQVWTVPQPGGRGAEVARLITPGRVNVSCAAFSPDATRKFLVVGTAAGTVHVWTPPTDVRKTYTGQVVNVDSTDPRYVTVRVEMDNKELNLLDRSTATVIINPGQ